MLMNFNENWVKRVTVQLEDDLHKQVKVWAAENAVSMNDVFVEAITAYMQQVKADAAYSGSIQDS